MLVSADSKPINVSAKEKAPIEKAIKDSLSIVADVLPPVQKSLQASSLLYTSLFYYNDINVYNTNGIFKKLIY